MKPGRIATTVAAVTAAASLGAGVAPAPAQGGPEGSQPISPANTQPAPPRVPIQPQRPTLGTTPEAPIPPITPDAQLPWIHAAAKHGADKATQTITELVENAKQRGWQVDGNDKSGGEGAFESITSPGPDGETHTAAEGAGFNEAVNGMLDEQERLNALKKDDGVLGGGKPQNQGPGAGYHPGTGYRPKSDDGGLGNGGIPRNQGPGTGYTPSRGDGLPDPRPRDPVIYAPEPSPVSGHTATEQIPNPFETAPEQAPPATPVQLPPEQTG